MSEAKATAPVAIAHAPADQHQFGVAHGLAMMAVGIMLMPVLAGSPAPRAGGHHAIAIERDVNEPET